MTRCLKSSGIGPASPNIKPTESVCEKKSLDKIPTDSCSDKFENECSSNAGSSDGTDMAIGTAMIALAKPVKSLVAAEWDKMSLLNKDYQLEIAAKKAGEKVPMSTQIANRLKGLAALKAWTPSQLATGPTKAASGAVGVLVDLAFPEKLNNDEDALLAARGVPIRKK